jgi:hypothetical protein
MFIKFIFCVAMVASSFFCSANAESVVGLETMKSIYQKTINVGATKNPPMPKLFIYDSKHQIFLSKEGTFKLLNADNESDRRALISFVGNTKEKPIKVVDPSIIEHDLGVTKKRFVAIYFNMPSDSLEPILSVMPEFLKKHTQVELAMSQNEDVVLYKTFF